MQRERDEATGKLDTLRTELASTKSQLGAQTEVTLLTVLSRDYPVNRGGWWLTLGGVSDESNDIVDYLAGKLPPEYKSLAEVSVNFKPFPGLNATTSFRHDGAKIVEIKSGDPPAEIALPDFLGSYDLPQNQPTGESTLMVSQDIDKTKALSSAAIAYRDLSRSGEVVAYVSLRLEKEFPTENEMNNFVSKNVGLKFLGSYKDDISAYHTARFSMPSTIKKAFTEYWKANFRGGRIFLHLDNPAYLMLSCDSAILDTHEEEGSITIRFKAISAPKIEVGYEES